MKHVKIAGRTILVASLLGGALGAQAADVPTATASLGDLQVQLVDLDTGDGIAPTATLTPGSSHARASEFVSPGQWAYSAPDHFSASLYQDAGNFASVANPSQTIAGATLEVTSTALGGVRPGRSGAAEFLDAITLTPHTSITVTGEASASIAGSGDPRSDANATFAGLVLGDAYADPLDPNAQPLHALLTGVSSSRLSTTFANYSDAAVQLTLSGYVEVQATSAVPEPGAAPLMLGGLALLGAAALRRRAARRG